MRTIQLGQTGIQATKVGFGVLPIQRVSLDEAKNILQTAYQAGVNYYDTARAYSDSEEKIGYALSHIRNEIYIATKTHAQNVEEFWTHLHKSLEMLQTDYIDIYQFHNPAVCPKPDDGSGLYEAMLEARDKGLIHHIGITSHKSDIALDAIASGLYETLQYPLSYISNAKDLHVYDQCVRSQMGFIAMKALCGGMLTNATAAFAYQDTCEHSLPIWGIQRMEELQEFIALDAQPPALDDKLSQVIESDRITLSGNFCRGCGYCLPCPVDIPINMAARMSFLLRRAVWQDFISPDWQEKMNRIHQCTECGACAKRCPYDLDTPNLLKYMLNDYEAFLQHKGVV